MIILLSVQEIFENASNSIQEGLESIVNDPGVVLLNVIVFLLMMVVVRVFLWEKVTAFLDKRQNALTEEFEKVASERAHAQELQQQAISDYERMKAETEDLKSKLTQEAYKEQERIVEDAKNEAKMRIKQAEKDIEYEIAQANEDIRQSIKEIAFTAAEKIVKREIDHDKHQDLIDEIIKERDDLKHE